MTPFGLQCQTPLGSFHASCLPASRSAPRCPAQGPQTWPLGAGPQQCRGQITFSCVRAPSPRQSSGLGCLCPSKIPLSDFWSRVLASLSRRGEREEMPSLHPGFPRQVGEYGPLCKADARQWGVLTRELRGELTLP